MGALQTWGDATIVSLQNLWGAFIGFLPNLIGAIIIILIGWVIAVALGRLAARLVDVFRIDQIIDKMNAKKSVERAGIEFNVANLIGKLVKWFFVIVFFMAAAEVLGLPEVTEFLRKIILYIPNIVIAVVILVAAVIAANFMAKVVKGSVVVAGLAKAEILAAVTRWAIVIFGLLAALDQLGVARSLIGTMITGAIAMVVIAGGLAFGLGGREQAANAIKKIRREITEKE